MSVTINKKLVDSLPLVACGAIRSPLDLAILTPESKELGGDSGFMLGGGQAASYGTTLDGVSTNTTGAVLPGFGLRIPAKQRFRCQRLLQQSRRQTAADIQIE